MLKQLGLLVLLSATIAATTNAETDQPDSAIKKADRLSSLTGRGAQPFHLKVSVSEAANPKSPYKATIEEFWQSAKDWTRTIETPDFEQHLVVTGGKRDEQDVGAYYPLWLRTFVTATTDPLEDSKFWERVDARVVHMNLADGHFSTSCARAQLQIGTPAATNDAFVVICFNADGTLSSLVRPGYDMEFHDLQDFGKKRIATRYVDNIEPGTELVGHVDVLEALDAKAGLPILQAFTDTPSGPIRSVPVKQEVLEGLVVTSTPIVWPPVHSGNTSGKLSMYVSTDRQGHIREAYPLNSDNAGLQDAARDQLLKWHLRAAVVDGQRVQTECALTFAFTTTTDTGAIGAQSPTETGKPVVLSQLETSKFRIKSNAPVYPQDLKEKRVSGKVELSAIIDKYGRIASLTPISSTDPGFTKAAISAAKQWTYKPYMLNGLPVEVETVITLNFNIQ